jgi:anthranilate phosphoribosyltransferase
MKEYLDIVFSGKILNKNDSEKVMDIIINNQASNEQISAFLGAISSRGFNVDEIVGFVKSIRKHSIKIDIDNPYLIDVCGTGGDNKDTFNISTAVAFVVSGAGIPVAKHGNGAVSSKSGSIDVLKKLGINVELNSTQIIDSIHRNELAFIFAPLFNPAMKNVGGIRKSIGVKTIFNILGPLCNPANVKKQIIGVYDHKLVNIIAEAMLQLDYKEAMIISSLDGMDEISLSDKTHVCHLKNNKLNDFYLTPEDFGLKTQSIENFNGGDSKKNAEIIESILKGEKSPNRDIVLANSALALQLTGLNDLQTSIKVAENSIDSGKAYKKLQDLKEFCYV